MAKFDYDAVAEQFKSLGVTDFEITKGGKFKKAAIKIGDLTVFFNVLSCFIVRDVDNNSYIDYANIADYCKAKKCKYDNLINIDGVTELMSFDMCDIDYEECASPEACAEQPIMMDGLDDCLNNSLINLTDDDVTKLIDIMGYIMFTFNELQVL